MPAAAIPSAPQSQPEPQPEPEPVQQPDLTPMQRSESEISTKPEPAPLTQPEKTPEHYDSWPPAQPTRLAAGLSPELLIKAQQATKAPEPHPLLGHDGVTVSHHMSQPKSKSIALTLLVLIVLSLIAGNFLMDAQVIKTNIKIPHTHLLKKQ
jgi:hypothetical protein